MIKKDIYIKNKIQSLINIIKKITPLKLRLILRKVNWRRMYYQKIIFNKKDEKVFCPIAKKSFVTFPNDITITNGARCRHRLFWLYLENETNILTEGNTVLHTAPQYGTQKKLQEYDNLNYIPCDKFMPGYDYMPNVINVDLLNIPFKDNYFDYVISNRVLEHIENDKKAMEEIFRVLKPNGTALLSVPMDPTLKETHESYTSRVDRIKYYGQWDHVRMYSTDIKNRLENVGFQVEMNRYSDKYSEKEMVKFGLCPDTIIVAKKL